MKTAMQAADSIRNLARLFKDMMECVEALEKVGALDQAIEERKAILAKEDGKIDQLKAAIQDKEQEMAVLVDHIDGKAAEACAMFRKNEAEACERAKSIVSDAESQAASIVSRANRQAAEAVANANRMLADGTAKLAKSEAVLADVDAEVNKKKAELAALEAKIEAAKDAARRLLS